MRRARERPNDISPPPPPAAAAARRPISTNSAIKSSVGPKPKIRLVRNDGPVSGDLASIVTFSLSSRLVSCWLLAKEGTWVEKRVVATAFLSLGGYLISFLNVP